MDDAFLPVYQDLVSNYRYSQLVARVLSDGPVGFSKSSMHANIDLRVVERAISQAVSACEARLRPDGELCLLVNLHQLVIAALRHADAPEAKHGRYGEKQLQEDTGKILTAAIQANGRDRPLSASDILRATVDVMNSLSLRSSRLWDPEQ